MRNLRKKLLFTLVVLAMVLSLATWVQADAVPTVWTDKVDYSPGETVIITGSGFDTNIEMMVRVTRPDNSVITGDGSGSPGSDTVTTDSMGGFTYYYILDGIEGLYTVEILCGDNVQATTTFTDSKPLFTATIDPISASPYQTRQYTITITDDDSDPPGNKLGSAIITIPTGFTSVSIENVTASDGKIWTWGIGSGQITLAATAPQQRLVPGQSVSVTFSATAPAAAPGDADIYEWTTTAYVNPSWVGDTFSLEGKQPAVTVPITITSSAGPHGDITPSGSVSVDYGASQDFTITPDANYHVADVLVDSASVGKVPSYTFTNVTVNHTIAASFAINTHTTPSGGGGGSIPPEPTPAPTPTPVPTPLLPPLEATVFWGIIGGIGHLGEIQSPVTTAPLTPTPATTNTASPTPTSGVAVPWALIVGIIGGMLFVTSFIFLILRWFRRPRPD